MVFLLSEMTKKIVLPIEPSTFNVASFLENNFIEENVLGDSKKWTSRQRMIPESSKSSDFQRFDSRVFNPFASVT